MDKDNQRMGNSFQKTAKQALPLQHEKERAEE